MVTYRTIPGYSDDGTYIPNMFSNDARNPSNGISANTAPLKDSLMGNSMIDPMPAPMFTPNFPMPGGGQEYAMNFAQPYVPNRINENTIAQNNAQAQTAQLSAYNGYSSWVHMNTQMQQGAPPLPSSSSGHSFDWSNPYALDHGDIQSDVQVAQGKIKKKRQHIRYTDSQLNSLKQQFEKNNVIRADERKVLSKNIGLSEKQIRIWFQNRRYHLKEDAKERYKM